MELRLLRLMDGNYILWEEKVDNIYRSNCNFRTATCLMSIIHSRNDKNYRECFCS